MKVALRLVLLLALAINFASAQNPYQDNPPKNLPSNSGYLQQAITENNSSLQTLGMNPIDVKNQKQAQNVQIAPVITTPQQPGANAPVKQATVAGVPDTTLPFVDTTRLPRSAIYGHDFFRNKSFQIFSRTTDAQAAGNYIIGLGDQISVNVWGYSSYSGSYTVDQNGSIMPEGVGKIYIKGLTLDKARQLIRSRFATYLDMPNSQIEVTIIYSRVITANIVGDVFNPGSYSIPAINTAFNALIASGGPTDLGTVRNIFVKRQGNTVRKLDVYKFLLDPNSSTDFFLENNDYIFVPPAEKIVSIGGEINRPYKYELIDGEGLGDLITYAGGLTAKAYTRAIQVKRFTGNQYVLLDVNMDSLNKTKGKFPLLNGDEILISTVPQDIFHFVKVSGAVRQPGQYNFNEGMRITDILSQSHGLKESAMTDRAYIIRKNADLTSSYVTFIPANIIKNPGSGENILLQNLDELVFFDKQTFVDTVMVTIEGAVRLPGKYTYANGMTLRDLLFSAGGLKPEAANTRIEISRYDSSGTNAPHVVQTFAIDRNLQIASPGDDYNIAPFDFVFVRSVSALDTQMVVTLTGEVMYPGTYSLISKDEKLVDVIQRAGGLTQWADANEGTLVRKEENRGLVFMELDKAMKNPESRYNILLKGGDEIDIPVTNDIVSVSGMINFPYKDSLGFLNAPWKEGKRAKWYVKKYGLGFAPDAKRPRTYVIQPGGTVQDPRRWTFIRIYPKVQKGASVVVPYILSEDNITVVASAGATTTTPATAVAPKPVDWNNVIESAMVKLTGLLTLYVLITRINF
ncbi:MAG: SLBB domain-containing protein [Chitinophagales bacterium]